jgi:soluble lytic murein transglycosylase-like protein
MDRFPTSRWQHAWQAVSGRLGYRGAVPWCKCRWWPPRAVPPRSGVLAAGRGRFLAALIAASVFPSPVGQASVVPPAAPVGTPPNLVDTLSTALSRCRPELEERQRWHIAGVIFRESGRYGYDPLFVLALVEVESACSPTARSRHGAVGLIQLRPPTARALAQEVGLRWRGTRTLTTPVLNVHLGLRYLAQLEKQFHDSYLAMAAYNLGPSRVARMPRQRARRADYVRKVLSRYEDLLAAQRLGRS